MFARPLARPVLPAGVALAAGPAEASTGGEDRADLARAALLSLDDSAEARHGRRHDSRPGRWHDHRHEDLPDTGAPLADGRSEPPFDPSRPPAAIIEPAREHRGDALAPMGRHDG